MNYLTVLFLTIIIFNILLTSYGKPRVKSLKKSYDNSIEKKKKIKVTIKKNKKKSKKTKNGKNRKIDPFATRRSDPLYRHKFENPRLRG